MDKKNKITKLDGNDFEKHQTWFLWWKRFRE